MKNEKQAKKLIKGGQFIAAVKIIRDSNGLGLKESKDICEQWREDLGLTPKPAPVDEAAAMRKIHDALLTLPQERRGPVCKAAAILVGVIFA